MTFHSWTLLPTAENGNVEDRALEKHDFFTVFVDSNPSAWYS
jgi:hypothetical protein